MLRSLFNWSTAGICFLLCDFTICSIWMMAEKCTTSSENLFLPYANNKGAEQPLHLHSLIRAFVVCCLDSIIPTLAIAEISSLCSWAGWFESYQVTTPEDRFSHDKAQIYAFFLLFFMILHDHVTHFEPSNPSIGAKIANLLKLSGHPQAELGFNTWPKQGLKTTATRYCKIMIQHAYNG